MLLSDGKVLYPLVSLLKGGIRQDSTSSSFIFNIFVNLFIFSVQQMRSGCCVCGHFMGCVLYADDILHDASVDGLWIVLNCCYDLSVGMPLTFNCTKSSCFYRRAEI
jgi:hypothetical protein